MVGLCLVSVVSCLFFSCLYVSSHSSPYSLGAKHGFSCLCEELR